MRASRRIRRAFRRRPIWFWVAVSIVIASAIVFVSSEIGWVKLLSTILALVSGAYVVYSERDVLGF